MMFAGKKKSLMENGMKIRTNKDFLRISKK